PSKPKRPAKVKAKKPAKPSRTTTKPASQRAAAPPPPAPVSKAPTPLEEVEKYMAEVARRNPGEPEFHQAVREVADSVMPLVLADRRYRDAKILERMAEPDRVISFRVAWEDDQGIVQVNRAWRVQFNGAIGPYKGGMRFHGSVNV